MIEGKILKVSGPLVVAEGMRAADLFDVVRVGKDGLVGEIIEMHGDRASIQVYEETAGLGRGDRVVSTGAPLSVELGPGLLTNIYDGIQRPLEVLRDKYGPNIERGMDEPALSRERRWYFEPALSYGDVVSGGDVYGYVTETETIRHKIMVPPGKSGVIAEIHAGEFTVDEPVGKLRGKDGSISDITLMQKWPVRRARPYTEKLPPAEPLISGQRAIDALFPIAKGGTACVPGPFGSGKTVVQHQLAKWSDVDLVVYIGCGERGNEMTDVLREFPTLKDPRTGRSLMERTVLIANTSDMPVAAREASVYTGMTIAEYYRDMGYSVAVIADSTSRWAEALREMSGRLEEMPGEEGYPAYLTSRLAQFYERAGKVVCLGKEGRIGTLSAIGAVSPQGGDISEPVTQATLRIVKVFWGLDANLAYRRHFPAINWLNSYSLYRDRLSEWFGREISPDWMEKTGRLLAILQKEDELQEIVKLVGMDALSPEDRMTMETAQSVREDFLQQDAFSDNDAYTALPKMSALMDLILYFDKKAREALSAGADVQSVSTMPVREKIGRAKAAPAETYPADYEAIRAEIDRETASLTEGEREENRA
ncbi:MAG: V-type ATP synthase subunit A [Clostridia bacterium]|nr:V-type ATP synthase subunit A [Clostridia bacterium]MDD7700385.1 V-type ATP synthase subunit A [Eubacteriales bacterium]MDY2827014.1 V-type ATP synthase subunit A [Eubacteriales bacterium]